MSLSDIFCVARHKQDFYELLENDLDILIGNENEINKLANKKNLLDSVNQLKKGDITFSLLNMQGQEMYKWEKREMFLSASQQTLILPNHLRGSYLLLIQSNQEKAAMPVFIH